MTLVLDLFRHGGFIMYPLLILSLGLWSIIFWRFISLRRSATDPYGLACSVVDVYEREGRPASVALVSHHTGLFAGLLQGWLENDKDSGIPSLISAAQEKIIPSKGLLQPLIQVAPLLGLLGTVAGMVQTFTVLAEMGSASPTALSGGIGQALITTQAGLSIALAALFGATLIENREQQVLQSIERAGLILTQLERGQA
jgi:biopolymer transport protein ExbB